MRRGVIWEGHLCSEASGGLFYVPLKHPEATGGLALQPCGDTARWQQASVHMREGFGKFNFTRKCWTAGGYNN